MRTVTYVSASQFPPGWEAKSGGKQSHVEAVHHKKDDRFPNDKLGRGKSKNLRLPARMSSSPSPIQIYFLKI